MDSKVKIFSTYREARAYCQLLAKHMCELRAIYAEVRYGRPCQYYVGTVQQLQRRFGAGAALVRIQPFRRVNRKREERQEIYTYWSNDLTNCAIENTMRRYGLCKSSVYRIINEFKGAH